MPKSSTFSKCFINMVDFYSGNHPECPIFPSGHQLTVCCCNLIKYWEIVYIWHKLLSNI